MAAGIFDNQIDEYVKESAIRQEIEEQVKAEFAESKPNFTRKCACCEQDLPLTPEENSLMVDWYLKVNTECRRRGIERGVR